MEKITSKQYAAIITGLEMACDISSNLKMIAAKAL